MKNLYNYLTEKLKLSDINKDNLDGRWVDAKYLNFKDIKEGYIIELTDGKLFVVIPLNFFIELRKIEVSTDYDYVFANIGYFGADGIEYITFESYQDTYPKSDGGTYNFIIKRVYKRNKKYINADEVYKDLYDICKNNKIN